MGKFSVNCVRYTAGLASMMLYGAACAQSAVTIYGIVDASVQYANKVPTSTGHNAGNAYALTNGGLGPSLFGIKGHEDLGGSLTTNFDLESGISMANGGYGTSNGNFWGRRAWVGIGSRYGEIRAGVQASPFFLSIWESDARGFSSFGSGIAIYADNVVFTGGVNSTAITYLSPKAAGFEASVMFAPGGVAGSFQNGQQWSASAKYDNGTVMINAAAYHGNGGGASTPVPTTVQFDGRTLGASYRLNGLTIKASAVNYNVAGSFNEYVYSAGANYLITPTISVNAGAWYSTDQNHKENHSLLTGIGVIYLASVRTSFYAQVAAVSNHGNMNTGLSVTDTSITKGVHGETTYGANFGIRHAF